MAQAETPRYTKVPAWAFDTPGITATARLVLLYLISRDFGNEETRKGEVWPSQITVGKNLGLNRKTVGRAFQELIDGGAITVVEKQQKGRGHRLRINYENPFDASKVGVKHPPRCVRNDHPGEAKTPTKHSKQITTRKEWPSASRSSSDDRAEELGEGGDVLAPSPGPGLFIPGPGHPISTKAVGVFAPPQEQADLAAFMPQDADYDWVFERTVLVACNSITNSVWHRLESKHGVNAIAYATALLIARLLLGKPIDNPIGWLVRAVENDYKATPEDVAAFAVDGCVWDRLVTRFAPARNVETDDDDDAIPF